MMKYVLLLMMLAVVIVGCNTVRGVGQDVQGGGEAIERAAG